MVRCISIIIATYLYNGEVYLGCHFDNMPKKYRYKKISSCGGNVDAHESFKQGAMREAREEHGLIFYNKRDA